jgi:hypothetical protein
MKASRDSVGKTSTFIHAGQKLDFDRVQKTIRRSRHRVAKSAAGANPPPPSRVECRTPSPEPLAVKDDVDLLDSLDPESLHIDGSALHDDFCEFGSDAALPFPHANVSDSFMAFSSPSEAGQFDPFDASSCRYEDPRVEMIWEKYTRAHQKLALRCEWLRTDSLCDPALERFRSDNSLLAMVEPLVAASGRHVMRELFLANFVSSFMHRPELSQFALHVDEATGHTFRDTTAASHYSTVIERALQYLGLQTYTRRFIGTKLEERQASESPPSPGEAISTVKTEGYGCLSPDVDFPSPGTEMPPTPPSDSDYDHSPSTNQFEAAAFAYHLRETDTAETRLRALTSYEGPVSEKRGQVLMRLAWYCLSRVQRESGRVDEADRSLMQAIRRSTLFPAADGTEWDEVSYLFM